MSGCKDTELLNLILRKPADQAIRIFYRDSALRGPQGDSLIKASAWTHPDSMFNQESIYDYSKIISMILNCMHRCIHLKTDFP
jgi:hypothetical protein